jgi:hypothetical protein
MKHGATAISGFLHGRHLRLRLCEKPPAGGFLFLAGGSGFRQFAVAGTRLQSSAGYDVRHTSAS